MNKILKTIIIPGGITYVTDIEWGLGDDGQLYYRNPNGDPLGRMYWSEYDGLSIREMNSLVLSFNNLLPFI